VPLTSTPAEIAQAVLAQLQQPTVAPRMTLPTWDDCASALLGLYRAVGEASPCA